MMMPERAQKRKATAAEVEARREQQLIERTGLFIRTWAHTEWLLFMLMAALLTTDLERARIVWASSTSFRSKRELLSRVGESFLVDALLPPFREIIGQAKHLSEKRNMVAHDRAYHMGRGMFRFMNDDDATQPNTFGRYRDVPVSNLATWAREASDLGQQVLRLSAQIEALGGGAFLVRGRVIPGPDQDRDESDPPPKATP